MYYKVPPFAIKKTRYYVFVLKKTVHLQKLGWGMFDKGFTVNISGRAELVSVKVKWAIFRRAEIKLLRDGIVDVCGKFW